MSSEKLAVRVCDPIGPRWTRAIATILAVGALVVGPLLPADARVRATTALLGVALLFGQRLVRVRHAPRNARLVVGQSSIRLTGAGVLGQEILAEDVLAASTARTERGVALAVVRKHSPERPLLLEFATGPELDRVRGALRIGVRGFGRVSWPTSSAAGFSGVAALGLALLCVPWLAMAAFAAFDLTEVALMVALLTLPATGLVLMIVGILGLFGARPGSRLVLSDAGLLCVDRWRKALPYTDIVDAQACSTGVVASTGTGPLHLQLPEALAEEREHVAAQIRSAAQRARWPALPDVPASLAVLAPRAEPVRAWLERLDAEAVSLGSPDGAYRRSGLDTEELWNALESADVATPVRAAAARVLARLAPEEARVRVAQVLATDHDPHARACIRVALEEDLDEAAQELERLQLRG